MSLQCRGHLVWHSDTLKRTLPRPPTARIIVGHGGLSVLCANLLNIEYIDVAELTVSTIELVSEASAS